MSVYLKCKAGGGKFSLEGKTSADKPYLAMNYTTQTGSESSQTTMSKAYIPLTTNSEAAASDKNVKFKVTTQTGNTPTQTTTTKLYALGRPVKTITYTSWSATSSSSSSESTASESARISMCWSDSGSTYILTSQKSSSMYLWWTGRTTSTLGTPLASGIYTYRYGTNTSTSSGSTISFSTRILAQTYGPVINVYTEFTSGNSSYSYNGGVDKITSGSISTASSMSSIKNNRYVSYSSTISVLPDAPQIIQLWLPGYTYSTFTQCSSTSNATYSESFTFTTTSLA